MPLMDEFKEEREAIKQASPKEKIKYFIYYYKWHTIAVIAVIIIAVVWIHDVATSKDTAFYAAFINGAALENTEEFNLAYAAYAGIDTDAYDIVFDTSLFLAQNGADEISVATSQKLLALSAAGDLDIMGTSVELFSEYANSTFFYDLRDILTEEQLNACEPYLYYVDRPVMEQLDNADPDFEGTDPAIEIPDPARPDLMEDPIPVGLFTDELTTFTDYYYLGSEGGALGIPLGTKNPDNAIRFLQFITR